MNKYLKRIIAFMIVFMLMTVGVKMDTQAAGGLSISASASQVSEGGTFTVTVKAAGNYFVSNIKLNVSGGTQVAGLGKVSLDKGESTTAKIKLTGETCTVSVSGTGANYDTEAEGAASASVTVKKKPVDNRSKDNTLSSLTVSAGSLSPEFNPSTMEYSVSLSGSAETITLGAQAKDAKAKVSGIGEKALVPGNNQFAIICTAENGAQKQYTVNVYVDETPLVFTTYNEQKLGVVRNQTELGIPATFEPATVQLEGQDVQAYESGQFGRTIVYLVNDAGEKNFYMYDAEKGITSVFKPVSILGRNVVIYDLSEKEQIREHMIYSEVTIDGITLYGWVYDKPEYENYIHIQVLNELGEKVVYQYEKTENSLQLFKEYVEEVVEVEKTIFPNEYYMYAICGLGALALILLISLICVAAKKRRQGAGFEDETQVQDDLYGDFGRQTKAAVTKPAGKARRHDARRRKAAKRMEKERLKKERKQSSKI